MWPAESQSRHTFGVRTYGATRDIDFTRRQMRHRSLNSTIVYMHAVEHEQLAAQIVGLV